MRKSKLKHPLAVLRTVLRKGQKEMAEMMGCSNGALQSIEIGRLALSDNLASRIALETGIDLGWLKKGDPSAPPIDDRGSPFTKAYFEQWQAMRSQENLGPRGLGTINALMPLAFILMASACLAAFEEERVPLFRYKLMDALKEIAKEFGLHKGGKAAAFYNEAFATFQMQPQIFEAAHLPGMPEAVASFRQHFNAAYMAKVQSNPKSKELVKRYTDSARALAAGQQSNGQEGNATQTPAPAEPPGEPARPKRGKRGEPV